MELVLTQQDIEPLPRKKRETYTFKNEGLLRSTYKQKTCKNFFHSNPKSVFGVKQNIKSRRIQFTSSIETVLKLSIFVIAMVITLS